MDTVALTIGISWILAGILIVALAIPLVRGRIRRNHFYGVRLSQSFQSDDAWFAINRFGGQRLIICALPMVLIGVACFFMHLNHQAGLAIFIGVAPLIFIFIPILETWRFARRYQ